jgi:hypothetical protein
MRSAGGTVLAGGQCEILRRIRRRTIFGVAKKAYYLIQFLGPATTGEEGTEGSGLDRGVGVGEDCEEGPAGLRLCNLVAQRPRDAHGAV